MRETIFLAITRHAKLKIGIAQFRSPADRTTMKRLLVAPRLDFETLPPFRDFLAVPEPLNCFRPEENKEVRERDDESQFSAERCSNKSEEKKGRYDRRDPFDLHRQDKEDVHDLVRAKAAASEQDRRSQHDV